VGIHVGVQGLVVGVGVLMGVKGSWNCRQEFAHESKVSKMGARVHARG